MRAVIDTNIFYARLNYNRDAIEAQKKEAVEEGNTLNAALFSTALLTLTAIEKALTDSFEREE